MFPKQTFLRQRFMRYVYNSWYNSHNLSIRSEVCKEYVIWLIEVLKEVDKSCEEGGLAPLIP
jgi:hypothetical protein